MEQQTESNTTVEDVQEGLLVRGTIVQIQGMPFALNGDARVLGNGANIIAVGMPLAPPDTDRTCYEKAKANGETTFTLRSQDISAPTVVKFWIKAQQRIAASLAAGLTLDLSVQAVEKYYFLDGVSLALTMPDLTPKQAGALEMAEGMEKYEKRKLAD